MEHLGKGQHFGENKSQLITNDVILNRAIVNSLAQIPWHYHENAYFLYNLNGYFNEITKKGTLDMIPGSLAFHYSQDPHYNSNILSTTNFFHVELTDSWFIKYNLQPNLVEGNILLLNPTLKLIFRKLYIESTINDKASQIAIDSLILQAFSIIIRQQSNLRSIKPDWTEKIMEIINDEKWDNLSLTSLANELKLNPIYLSRKFYEYFNINLGEYIRNKKIERATFLLHNKDMNNASIAYECGFYDESHFLKVFKSKFCMTPNQYRKNLKAD